MVQVQNAGFYFYTCFRLFVAAKIKLKRVCGLVLASFVRFTQLPMNVFVINIKIYPATLQNISGLQNKWMDG